MILYKYYGYESGLSALKSSQLGFRKPENFNDPFELTFFSQSKSRNKAKPKELKIYLDNFRDSVAILSLTRTPKNPLMWAHYGENHTGFVVGYDANDPFLNDHEYNVITASEGDVVYTNTKFSPVIDAHTMKILREVHNVVLRGDFSFNGKEYDQVRDLSRKIFLTKHASWVYEEEVRIVKTPFPFFMESSVYQDHPYRSFDADKLMREITPSVVQPIVNGLFLYTHKTKIKEVYLGIRNPLRQKMPAKYNDFSLKEKANKEKWKIFGLDVSESSWELKVSNLVADNLEIPVIESDFAKIYGRQLKVLNGKVAHDVILDDDQFEVTTWRDKLYVKKNDNFI